MSSIKSHGGARPGAGRKSIIGGTVVKRVPVAIASAINVLVARHKDGQTLPDDAQYPSSTAAHFELPLYEEGVRAGFPSPAQGYVDRSLDLNEHLAPNRTATFFTISKGDSMIGAGIDDGDLLVVDRSIEAVPGDIVVASVGGDFTVKYLQRVGGKYELHPANPAYPVIAFEAHEDNQVIGVVTSVVKNVRAHRR